MLEITFAEPEKNTKRTRQGLQKISARKPVDGGAEWTKERLLLQFRTMGAFALREKQRKEDLEQRGVDWRTSDKYAAAREESLLAFLPSCEKCGEVLICKSCTRFECDECGYILQCIRCIRRREKVDEVKNAGSRRLRLPVNTGVQYSILDVKRVTGDVLFDDPISQMEFEHVEEQQRLEKEILRLNDQLNETLGKSDTYFEKFHAARADWKVEQRSRMQLEQQLANAKAEIRNLSDALIQAKTETMRIRDIMLDSADQTHERFDQMMGRWGDQDAQSLLTLTFRAWRSGRVFSHQERQIETLTGKLEVTTNALNEAKALILRMNQTIDGQDAKLREQRAKLVAAAKEKIGRVLGSWRPHARALKAWGAAALVAKAEREKELAVTAAGEAFQLLDRTEKQKREITRLNRDLEKAEAEAAQGRIYMEELGRSNRLVKRLKERVSELEEERRLHQLKFEEEKKQLKVEIQKIHHSILTDTHASVLHETIEKLKGELDHERSSQSRRINSFMSTASSSMCGSCCRATLYRSFIDGKSSVHDDTVFSSGFLPQIPSKSKSLRDTL